MSTVINETTLSNSFFGNTKQICIVTRDVKRTLAGMVNLGIGPWSIYIFDENNCTDVTYRGKPSKHTMYLALATSGDMLWEVIQPLQGKSIYTEFLDDHAEGIHHVAPVCEGLSYLEQVAKFESMGYPMVQSGLWAGKVPYAYFETEGDISTTLEIFDIPEDFEMPEPIEWYPAKPPAAE